MLIADWITLSPEVARSLLITYVLITAFWPLTILAIIALVFWWRRRTSRATQILAGIAVLLWTISAVPYFYYYGGEAVNRAQLRARQETLPRARSIAGIALPAGTLVTYSADNRGEIESLELKEAASVSGIPLIGSVNFERGRPNGYVTLARDATVDGVPCSARADVQLRDGALDTCTLSKPSAIRGIPCQGVVALSNGTECTLASEYHRFGVTWRAETRVSFDRNGASFDVMGEAPNLYFLGSPLPSRANVSFVNGRLSGVNLTTNGSWHFRGCSIGYIGIRNDTASLPRAKGCDLPLDRDGNVAVLPSAFSVR
jgi:hypothetical protein